MANAPWFPGSWDATINGQQGGQQEMTASGLNPNAITVSGLPNLNLNSQAVKSGADSGWAGAAPIALSYLQQSGQQNQQTQQQPTQQNQTNQPQTQTQQTAQPQLKLADGGAVNTDDPASGFLATLYYHYPHIASYLINHLYQG